ncbi:MAG TPA: PBP1A family penicillin-binding protein [Candidatus Paceibacterota bacterium]|nr:PBP1A family penicillin-binding protein [Candidatus Paceibacterota bacterium]
MLTLAAWCATLGIIALSIFVIHARETLPDPDSIATRQVKESTKIYDRTGTVVLYDIYNEEKRTVVPFDQMSDSIKQATVAIEDSRFYEHRGFDVQGFFRSLLHDIQSGSASEGGSTITQQLVGNALVGRQKTVERKVQELILAIEVEQRFTKDQILGMYLNQIPYGSNTYGIEAASEMYFGIHAAQLDLAQAALLASLPQQPSYLSPYGSHVTELLTRKDYVLQRMKELGYITADQMASAQKEDVISMLKPQGSAVAAPHFVEMVKDYLTQKYGEDILTSGGLRIVTTLDANLQQQANDLVAKYGAINKTKYKASNAALAAIDPRDGSVLALVGSVNYSDTANQGNFNVITSPNRQPGSAFKPFAYAVAFQKGYPDTTILWDKKTEFNPLCSPDGLQKTDPNGQDCYHPQDYSGTFSGPVTMRSALDESLNVPAVQTLYLAGINDVINLATNMGITTLGDTSRWGLSLVLGGAEVKPIDLVSAYGVFANDGIRVPWGLVQEVDAPDGTVLEQRQIQPTRVLDTQTARLMDDVLSDNSARAPEFGINNSLTIPGRPVAAKTGTTQDNRDGWVVGFTPSLATVVWTGNNDNSPMTAAGAGISAAGPLWNAFMSAALSGTPVESFPPPNPVVTDKIMLNGSVTSPQYPDAHSLLFYVDKNDPLGPIPTDPTQDPQFANWEWAVQH